MSHTGIAQPSISNPSVTPTAPPPGFYLDTNKNTVKPIPKMTYQAPQKPIGYASDEAQARRLRASGIYSDVRVAKPRFSNEELEAAF